MLDQIFSQDCKYIIKKVNLIKIENSRVLILGANSFFAAYIQSVLLIKNCKLTSISLNKPKGIFKILKKNKNVKYIQLNLSNSNRLKNILIKKFDYIFHCATYGQPQKWAGNEFNTINLNTNVVKLILDHSKKFKSKILFLSSSSLYDASTNKKYLDENSKLGEGNFLQESFYINSKIIAEKLCKMYKERYNLPVFIARLGHTYGPGQNIDDPRVLPQLIKRAIFEKKVYLFDRGSTIRTWTYIADAVIMLLNIIQYGKSDIYNVCGKESQSILSIAKLVSKNFNKIPLEFRDKNLSYTNRKSSVLKISSKKYFKEFKKINFLKFSNGLDRLIKWNKFCLEQKK